MPFFTWELKQKKMCYSKFTTFNNCKIHLVKLSNVVFFVSCSMYISEVMRS